MDLNSPPTEAFSRTPAPRKPPQGGGSSKPQEEHHFFGLSSDPKASPSRLSLSSNFAFGGGEQASPPPSRWGGGEVSRFEGMVDAALEGNAAGAEELRQLARRMKGVIEEAQRELQRQQAAAKADVERAYAYRQDAERKMAAAQQAMQEALACEAAARASAAQAQHAQEMLQQAWQREEMQFAAARREVYARTIWGGVHQQFPQSLNDPAPPPSLEDQAAGAAALSQQYHRRQQQVPPQHVPPPPQHAQSTHTESGSASALARESTVTDSAPLATTTSIPPPQSEGPPPLPLVRLTPRLSVTRNELASALPSQGGGGWLEGGAKRVRGGDTGTPPPEGTKKRGRKGGGGGVASEGGVSEQAESVPRQPDTTESSFETEDSKAQASIDQSVKDAQAAMRAELAVIKEHFPTLAPQIGDKKFKVIIIAAVARQFGASWRLCLTRKKGKGFRLQLPTCGVELDWVERKEEPPDTMALAKHLVRETLGLGNSVQLEVPGGYKHPIKVSEEQKDGSIHAALIHPLLIEGCNSSRQTSYHHGVNFVSWCRADSLHPVVRDVPQKFSATFPRVLKCLELLMQTPIEEWEICQQLNMDLVALDVLG